LRGSTFRVSSSGFRVKGSGYLWSRNAILGLYAAAVSYTRKPSTSFAPAPESCPPWSHSSGRSWEDRWEGGEGEAASGGGAVKVFWRVPLSPESQDGVVETPTRVTSSIRWTLSPGPLTLKGGRVDQQNAVAISKIKEGHEFSSRGDSRWRCTGVSSRTPPSSWVGPNSSFCARARATGEEGQGGEEERRRDVSETWLTGGIEDSFVKFVFAVQKREGETHISTHLASVLCMWATQSARILTGSSIRKAIASWIHRDRNPDMEARRCDCPPREANTSKPPFYILSPFSPFSAFSSF